VLLVLSETSIKSHWVKHEVEAAIAKEEKDPTQKKTLIPFCIDQSFEQTDVAWASLLRHERNIGDFTGWKDHDKYKKAFDDLLKWLKYETKKEESDSP